MEYTIEELKVMAYDRMVLIQNATNELNQINKAIEDAMNKPVEGVMEESVIDETE